MTTSQFLRPVDYESRSLAPFGQLPQSVDVQPQPCEVDIPTQKITDLKRMVQDARLGPITFENSQSEPNNSYGLTRAWMDEAIKTWIDESSFNWEKIQEGINNVPHYTSKVSYKNQSYSVHFTALFSKRSDAIPLVNAHGWPGCFLEFLPIMNLLKQRYTPETLPYHFVALSMPGYTFSSGPPETCDLSIFDVSCIFKEVLRQLGFHKTGYVVQGGDIGSRVARGLAVKDDACIGVHLSFCFDIMMHSFPKENLEPQEAEDLAAVDEFIRSGNGYSLMHAHRSATIGFILSSSPVALLAWIGEKLVTWTDTTPPMTTILTFITLYWLTDTFPRSIYPYRADFTPSDNVPAHGNPLWNIPDHKEFGYSGFPKEILRAPKPWVERTGNLSFWKRHDRGGHFAALELPEIMLQDLEEFVKQADTKRKS